MVKTHPPLAAETPVAKGTGGRPTREASAAIGDAILNTAWRLFIAHGYKNLSIELIAKEAAVSKRTLYDRFTSKEGLLEALVTRAIETWANEIYAVSLSSEKTGWFSAFVSHALSIMSSYDARALGAFMTTEGHAFPMVMALQAKRRENALNNLACYLGERIEGFPDGEDGYWIATSFLVFIRGWGEYIGNASLDIRDPQLSGRIQNEARALFALYGCHIK